ncbi:MAG: recombination mediator RecR [Parcubacteria group bacterium]
MNRFPDKLEKLIETFSLLPGIGRKTAERFVFFLLKQPKETRQQFATAIADVGAEHFFCSNCFNLTVAPGLCAICSSGQRQPEIICVVEEIQDLQTIESTGEFHGLYHILGGKIDPTEGMTPDKLTIAKLLGRIQTTGVKEVILALNPDMRGEGTILHLKKLLQPTNVKITLLARGLPMGGEIEYADEITLANALKGRREI